MREWMTTLPPTSVAMPRAHQMHGAHQPRGPLCTQVAVGLSENGWTTHGPAQPGWQTTLWLASSRLSTSLTGAASTLTNSCSLAISGAKPSSMSPRIRQRWLADASLVCSIISDSNFHERNGSAARIFQPRCGRVWMPKGTRKPDYLDGAPQSER